MELLALIGSGTWVHMLLVSSAFDDWHGLLASPRFYGPLAIGTGVCVLWVLACLTASWLLLLRRDFAGPPVPRRRGWAVPVGAVLGAAALVVALGAATNLGPTAVTKARLEASIAPAFSDLTVLQQEELGRTTPKGYKLDLRTRCARRAGRSQGPGDDWSCTLTVVTPQAGAEPFQLTPVTYDISVKSDGCYKAEAPPSFVGQQLMPDSRGHTVVNPLFTIYGCFDPTASAHCASSGSCAATAGSPTNGTQAPAPSSGAAPAGTGRGEREALRKAEQEAGPSVMREITESEKAERRNAEKGAEEAQPHAHK